MKLTKQQLAVVKDGAMERLDAAMKMTDPLAAKRSSLLTLLVFLRTIGHGDIVDKLARIHRV